MFNRVREILRDVWRWFSPPAIQLLPLPRVNLPPLVIVPIPANIYQSLPPALLGIPPVAVLNHGMVVDPPTQEEKDRMALLMDNQGFLSRILASMPLRDNNVDYRESRGSADFYAYNHAAPVGTTFPTQATMDLSPPPTRPMFS